jgi:hypothetical protein
MLPLGVSLNPSDFASYFACPAPELGFPLPDWRNRRELQAEQVESLLCIDYAVGEMDI